MARKRRISVTMLSSYLYCARKLFLERVLGLFEPEKAALVKGSIRHETYDGANQVEEKIVTSIKEGEGFEDIYNKYAKIYSTLLRQSITKNKYRLRKIKLPLIDAYHEIWPFFKRESEIRALNIYKFIVKSNLYGLELWDKLIPKVESEKKIASDELELKGIVDKIEIYPEGYVPVELKTGSMPKEGVWPGHRVQIGAYALMMEEKYGKEIKEAFVHYLDSDERRQVVVNPFLKEEVKELKDKVRKLLEGSKIPERADNQNKCRKCGLKNKCFDENFLKGLLDRRAKEKQKN
ncbi:CRISPR-associated protein Cas4 [Candidatus Woesearchaeota archaeon]|nr:CRISPR-associated protein Cas4 [Candidatus Woesearchaeota archaeon]